MSVGYLVWDLGKVIYFLGWREGEGGIDLLSCTMRGLDPVEVTEHIQMWVRELGNCYCLEGRPVGCSHDLCKEWSAEHSSHLDPCSIWDHSSMTRVRSQS